MGAPHMGAEHPQLGAQAQGGAATYIGAEQEAGAPQPARKNFRKPASATNACIATPITAAARIARTMIRRILPPSRELNSQFTTIE